MMPFLPRQITTWELGGTGEVLAVATGLGGLPLFHLPRVFAQVIIYCDIGLSYSGKGLVVLKSEGGWEMGGQAFS